MNEVELLSEPKNYAVVRLPSRNFPGVVMQGDTLNILLKDIVRVKTAVTLGHLADASEGLDDIIGQLEAAKKFYESVCQRKGIDLPY